MKLHIGCGRVILPGWVNLDIESLPGVDIQDDVRTLSKIASSSCQLIYACHVLEHLSRHEIASVLKIWWDRLRPGGLIRVAVPDFAKVVQRYRQTEQIEEVTGLLVGGQRNRFDYHSMVFDARSLSLFLVQAGFSQVREWDWRQIDHDQFDDYSQAYLPHMDKESGLLMSLNLEAIRS